MKTLIALAIALSSFSALAVSIDEGFLPGGPEVIYLSWCDRNNNVLQADQTGRPMIKFKCPSTTKCVQDEVRKGSQIWAYAECRRK